MCDFIMYSHEVGIAKPAQRIYALTCERLGLPPQATVFLDNDPSYVQSARDYGMQAILFQNNVQAIADIQACIETNKS